MSHQISPFAALSGAEKQIKWLEYQSIRLPYVAADIEPAQAEAMPKTQTREKPAAETTEPVRSAVERPQPPPEVPRTMPDFQKTRHSQYDAVIARMKQAELQSKRFQNLSKLSE